MKSYKLDYFANYQKNPNFFKIISAIFFNPGFRIIFYYRLINYFKLNRFLIIRNLYRYSCLKNNLDISIEAKIGAGLNLPHPIGIIIGKGVVIGKNVTIYQNSTLGSNVRLDTPLYPKIADGCIIGAGAIIIGDVETCPNFIYKANKLYK